MAKWIKPKHTISKIDTTLDFKIDGLDFKNALERVKNINAHEVETAKEILIES
jgi:hypothetical protein